MGAGDPLNRYARQAVLPEVGTEGQATLARARILVVGVGGLGCPALQYLAGAGAGRITIMDPDFVSIENLHRQTLFSMGDLGAGKVSAASLTLQRLNPCITIRAVAEPLTPSNVSSLLSNSDAVLDCADSLAVTYILSDACLERGIPLISASALGFSGYAAGFCGGAPSVRAVFQEPPAQSETCANAGVLGPVVGALGCIQAQMCLAVLLGLQPSPLGMLVRFDARALRFSSFRFDGAPEPAGRAYRFVSAAEISAEDFVVDLRRPDEAPEPATPFAIRLEVARFGAGGPLPNQGQRAVLCCRSGLRSWQAANRLRECWQGEIVLAALGGE